MKKRILSLLLVLLMVVSLVPTAAMAEDDVVAYEVTGGNIYFDKTTGTVTSCDPEVTEANIPSEIDGVAVTSIDGSAFYDCMSLADVYYTGSAEQWNAIKIGDLGNEALLNATIRYNYHEHVTELVGAKAATCTEDGYTGDEVCTICGETIKEGEVIPATGHHFKGNTCPDCGETRSTADTIRAWFQESFNNMKNFFDKIFGRN